MDNLNNFVLFLSKYINQFEGNIGNCVVPRLTEKPVTKEEEEGDQEEGTEEETEEDNVPVLNKELWQLKPYQETEEIQTPQLCVWDFMPKEELEAFMAVTSRSELRQRLEERIGKLPTGFSRIIAIEYLMDVTTFCKRSTFNIEQVGSILSIFYWTHKFFTTNLFVCPEDVYTYITEFMTFHSLFFPPTHFKIFTIEEGEAVLVYFCGLYLRHLPLVRMLTLPNFGFELEYVLEPEMKHEKSKKGKGKKDKKGKGKKDKKGKKK